MITRARARNWLPKAVQVSKKNETAGIPHDKFEHDLDLPEDAESRYSPEYLQKQREMIERLKKEQQQK
ncbi:hypothetical protein V1281_003134 [Nitrobacteraceae bacterium AZCC 2161]